MDAEGKKSTVYFDGSCPLCRAEISYYRKIDEDGGLSFVDVSAPHAAPPDGITRQQAMERFHVRTADGGIVSGAAAFVEVWGRLPRWRWLARAAALPGGVAVLELAYRSFLPVRPLLSRLFARVTHGKPLA
jgi:predicted DCC family thiol-disulfide oxidoreductase YuxK